MWCFFYLLAELWLVFSRIIFQSTATTSAIDVFKIFTYWFLFSLLKICLILISGVLLNFNLNQAGHFNALLCTICVVGGFIQHFAFGVEASCMGAPSPLLLCTLHSLTFLSVPFLPSLLPLPSVPRSGPANTASAVSSTNKVQGRSPTTNAFRVHLEPEKASSGYKMSCYIQWLKWLGTGNARERRRPFPGPAILLSSVPGLYRGLVSVGTHVPGPTSPACQRSLVQIFTCQFCHLFTWQFCR